MPLYFWYLPLQRKIYQFTLENTGLGLLWENPTGSIEITRKIIKIQWQITKQGRGHRLYQYQEGKFLNKHKHKQYLTVSLKKQINRKIIIEGKKLGQPFKIQIDTQKVTFLQNTSLDIFFSLKVFNNKFIANKYKCHSPGAFLCCLMITHGSISSYKEKLELQFCFQVQNIKFIDSSS